MGYPQGAQGLLGRRLVVLEPVAALVVVLGGETTRSTLRCSRGEASSNTLDGDHRLIRADRLTAAGAAPLLAAQEPLHR